MRLLILCNSWLNKRDMDEKRLVLFDIDGTLLDLKGAGRRAFIDTIRYVFGVDDPFDDINFSGATDLGVLHASLAHRKIQPSREQLSTFFELMPSKLEETALAERAVVYPGVPTLLQCLSGHKNILIGMVTGNAQATAWIKLRHAGLHEHFHEIGGFGDQHPDRDVLARNAVESANTFLNNGNRITRSILIGDTPSDIQAARSIDATAIAVATGSYTREQLAEYTDTHVFDDLSDTDTVLQRILG